MQRLKQGNVGAHLRPNKEDLLIAGETPRYDGKALRVIRMRVALNGFAERSVHDIGFAPSSFWHYWDYLPTGRVEEITALLQAAQRALIGKDIAEDPNGHYRVIDFSDEVGPVQLKMQYVEGVARHNVPAFETAWTMIVQQFPCLPNSV